MERIEGTVLCQIWFVTSDCRSRVIHQTQRHTKSFLFRRPSFSPSLSLSVARLLPSKNLKGADVSVYTQHLCTHTGHVQYTLTLSLSDALGYPHIVRM